MSSSDSHDHDQIQNDEQSNGSTWINPQAGTSDIIQWRLHLSSPVYKVFDLVTTDAGREKFWVEKSQQQGDEIFLRFPNDYTWQAKVLEVRQDEIFVIDYVDHSTTSFSFTNDGNGGTKLFLEDKDISPDYYCEVLAGWVSVLLNLKAVADHDADLRNHDTDYTWQRGYAAN